MARNDSSADAYAWEKELAPKVTGKYVAFVAGIYVLWIAFLAVVAIQRWFGSLQ